MSSDTSEPTDAGPPPPGGTIVFFDGTSNRRRLVTLGFGDLLAVSEDGQTLASWSYGDIRRADGPAGMLRLSCLTAPALARLEVRDAAITAELVSRCSRLDENRPGRGVAVIIGWSLAATLSIIAVVLFGVPLAADRLAPLVPESFERRLGDVADGQVKTLFGGKVCDDPAGQRAFSKLVNALRESAGMDTSVQSGVLATPVPNAFALPGGRVYLLNGLLAKAENVDEIAGVLAHELGHLRHRDNMRGLIYNGGTSFLIGLLFGDVTGSGALLFASRTLVTASYSREAEQNADTFAIDTMHRLGRPAKPMGELMFRITGKEGKGLSIISNHPLTEDRLARMSREDRPASGPPLLTSEEWRSLKAICDPNKVWLIGHVAVRHGRRGVCQAGRSAVLSTPAVPRCCSFSESAIALKSDDADTAQRARGSRAAPASVSAKPPGVRLNSKRPMLSSSPLSCRLTAGCVRFSEDAARETVPSRATVMKQRRAWVRGRSFIWSTSSTFSDPRDENCPCK
jgi:Zn-dependent protease with chaperone function